LKVSIRFSHEFVFFDTFFTIMCLQFNIKHANLYNTDLGWMGKQWRWSLPLWNEKLPS